VSTSSRLDAPPRLPDTGAMDKISLRWIGLIGALLGALALAIALGSEHVLDLIPCPLCLRERWPYRVAIAAGLLAFVLPRPTRRPLCWLLVAIYLAAAAAAAVHVGVEQHWWKSPLPECSAPDLRGLSAAERLARMPALPGKSCEDPDYLIPAIPLTMAQMNLLYSLAAAAFLAMLTASTRRRD
jgi:disulfide bond formation protein DsbB